MVSRFRTTVAAVGLLGLATALLAQPPVPTGAKPGDLSAQQQLNAKQFIEFKTALLRLAQKLQRSDAPEDQHRARVILAALELAAKENVDGQFQKLVATINVGAKTVNDVNGAIGQDRQLTKALQDILNVLMTDDEAARLKAEIETLKEYLDQAKKLKRDQELLRALNEANKVKADKVARDQGNLAERTRDLADRMSGQKKDGSKGQGGKAGEKDVSKADPKADAKGGDAAGEGKSDTQESKSDSKDPQAGYKPGEPKGGDPSADAKGSGKGQESAGSESPKKGDPDGASDGADGKPAGQNRGAGSSEKPLTPGGDPEAGGGKSSDQKAGGEPKAGSDAKAGGGPKAGGEPKAGGDPKPGSGGAAGDLKGAGDPKGDDAKAGEPAGAKAAGGAGSKPSGGGKSQGAGKGEAKSAQGQKGGDPKGKNDPPSGAQQASSKGGSKAPPSDGQSGSPGGQGGGQQQQQADQAPGRKQIDEAYPNQQSAERDLKEEKRPEAGKGMDKAVEKLGEAVAALEKRLKQLREEEALKRLANLEARCNNMLALQRTVYEQTKAIDAAVAKNNGVKTTVEVQRAQQQGDREGDIVAEADKALKLMEGEGSAVAFATVLEEVRQDMIAVQRRLGSAWVDRDTQAVEENIIAMLDDMVKALKKAQQDMKQQQQQQQQGGGQQKPGNQKLLDLVNELKLIRTLQVQVNDRTKNYGTKEKVEQALDPILQQEIKQLSARQAKLQDMINKIATGVNQ